MWCAFSQVEGINNGNTQQTTEMVSTLWHTGLIDKQQWMWQKLKIVQVCDFFSLFKEIKCSSHIKRWGDFLNNSTVFFLLCITKELKNIKRKMLYKIKKDNWYNNPSLRATWSSESENRGTRRWGGGGWY